MKYIYIIKKIIFKTFYKIMIYCKLNKNKKWIIYTVKALSIYVY